MNPKRIRTIKDGSSSNGPVVYWMSRDQRANDNWALIFARQEALQRRSPFYVVFCLVPSFLDATLREYSFMLEGLKKVKKTLEEKNISFTLLVGEPSCELPRFVRNVDASMLVTDLDPLRIKRKWVDDVAAKIVVPFHQVDARNIVPCWAASPKQEYGAYTLRPKIWRQIDEFLEAYPGLKVHPHKPKRTSSVSFADAVKRLKVDRRILPVDWISSGEDEALKAMKRFISNGLKRYSEDKNDPSLNAQSGLSPYLHFGQISSLTVYHAIKKAKVDKAVSSSFIEELIVRRELSDNYCFYNKVYDSFAALHPWAQKTLNEHRRDRRPYVYSLKELEEARTHDDLWNAAQNEMVLTGKMHGYMRMYWAKKILEWSKNPEDAIERAIYLNDRYELDGRDTNGYAGIMWSIGGLHDRAWNERPVFGKIRFMSHDSQIRKFNYKKYFQKVLAECKKAGRK